MLLTPEQIAKIRKKEAETLDDLKLNTLNDQQQECEVHYSKL